MSRTKNPGERSIHSFTGHRTMMDRTVRAQIQGVDAKNGFVNIDIIDSPSGGRLVTVPPLWMSFPDPKSSKGPAWGRFMPQVSDTVKVSFDTDHRAHIVGYDIIANQNNIADGRVGWPQLAKANEDSKKDDSDSKLTIFSQFDPINPGEFDFMSSGGAYILGTDKGVLYLRGGPSNISLFRQDRKITMNSQMLTYRSENTELRIGQVRRSNSDGTVGPVSVDTDKKFKEFSIDVKTESDSSSSSMATLQMGNVVDESGSRGFYKPNGTNEYYKYNLNAYGSNDSDGPVYSVIATENGNIFTDSTQSMWFNSKQVTLRFGEMYESEGQRLTINPDTSGDHVKFGAEVLNSNGDTIGNIHIADSGFVRVDTDESIYFVPQKKFTVKCDDIRLGDDNPSEHYVLGDSYRKAEKQYVSDLKTQISNIVSELQSLCGIISSFSSATDSLGVPIAALSSVSGSITPINVQLGNISGQLSSIEQTFNNGTDDYLSQKITGK